MQLFYTPDIVGDHYVLDEQESRHCIKVLRMQKGEELHLTDGKGVMYTALIENPNAKGCLLAIRERIENYEARSYFLHIAIAPTKNIERFEWFLEKSTELGINRITPLLCDHSERKIINQDRLERIIIAAMKQSIKAFRPQLDALTSYSDFISGAFTGQKFIAHCEDSDRKSLKGCYQRGSNATILIGPEGDFSGEEIKLATKANFIPVSLGTSRLRTETAGVAACHTIHLQNEE